jgi:hypothetical protein
VVMSFCAPQCPLGVDSPELYALSFIRGSGVANGQYAGLCGGGNLGNTASHIIVGHPADRLDEV